MACEISFKKTFFLFPTDQISWRLKISLSYSCCCYCCYYHITLSPQCKSVVTEQAPITMEWSISSKCTRKTHTLYIRYIWDGRRCGPNFLASQTRVYERRPEIPPSCRPFAEMSLCRQVVCMVRCLPRFFTAKISEETSTFIR